MYETLEFQERSSCINVVPLLQARDTKDDWKEVTSKLVSLEEQYKCEHEFGAKMTEELQKYHTMVERLRGDQEDSQAKMEVLLGQIKEQQLEVGQ